MSILSNSRVPDILAANIQSFHHLGRKGQPQDVVKAILYLASDRIPWVDSPVLGVQRRMLERGRSLN